MICAKKDCAGCFACVNVCPQKCISMKEDEVGYIYPAINEEACVKCDLCKKICPANHPVERRLPRRVYAAWETDDTQRKLSTSGGIATRISKSFLNDQGVVYGASYDQGEFKHIRVTSLNELEKIRGSKYVHSYINFCFQDLKKDLSENKKVLFIGTPCQVAGLKSIINDRNLFTIDIVCHGVSSQKLLRDEIGNTIFDYITFRDGDGYSLSLYREGNCIRKTPYYESLYYRGFLDALTCRENCYRCSYAESNRVGDITLGDFWGLGELKSSIKEENKGISLMMINTDKGQYILENISSYIFLEERSLKEAVKGNSQLRHPSKPHKNRSMFLENYKKIGYEESLAKALEYYSLKNYIKRTILKNDFLMSIVNKIK